MTRKELRAMWRCIDVDGDNSINISKFAAVFFGIERQKNARHSSSATLSEFTAVFFGI